MPTAPLNDALDDPFMDALLTQAAGQHDRFPARGDAGERPQQALRTAPSLFHPDERVTLASGEVVELPASPSLPPHDVNGWKRHIRALLQRSQRTDEPWRHRLDEEEAERWMALSNQHDLSAGMVEPLLRAGVSADPGAGHPCYLSAGMQEALLGLALAAGIRVTASDLVSAVQACTHAHLVQRLIEAVEGRPLSPLHPSVLGLDGAPDLLHAASANPHPGVLEIIDRLVAHGARLDHLDRDGQTALGEAVERNNRPVVERLLHHGVPVDRHGLNAHSPLGVAVVANNPGMIPLLLAAGASTQHKTQIIHELCSTTTLALMHGSDRALEALIAAGLDPLQTDAYLTAFQMTALSQATITLGRQQASSKTAGARACLHLIERLELRRTLDQQAEEARGYSPAAPADPWPTARPRSRL